jgi:hypothetical protein
MEKRTIKIDGRPTLRTLREIAADWCNYMVNILFITLIFFVGCDREIIVPQHLRGEWKTSAPTYEDRYMKFSEHTLTYGIGDGNEVTHGIDKIKSVRSDGGTVFTFYYRDAEGQKDKLTVIYNPASGGTLQIKNSVEIWNKADAGKGG